MFKLAITINDYLKNHLSNQRYEHTLRVADTAQKLATAHKIDTSLVKIAALLHDITKETNPNKVSNFVPDSVQSLQHTFPSIWHSKSAPYVAKHLFNIHHSECFQAIEAHTTGKAAMTPLEKILFVADAIEPGRPIKNQSFLLEKACVDLNPLIATITLKTIEKLLKKTSSIHPDTIACWNDYHSYHSSEIRYDYQKKS